MLYWQTKNAKKTLRLYPINNIGQTPTPSDATVRKWKDCASSSREKQRDCANKIYRRMRVQGPQGRHLTTFCRSINRINVFFLNLAVYSAFCGRHPQSRRSKTADITKHDITCAADRQNVNVPRSNVHERRCELLSLFTLVFAVYFASPYQISSKWNHTIHI